MQAGRRLAIALQRQNIAGLRRDIANDTVQFLGTKFLSAAMWLALQRAIRDQYRTRLNYAITASFMAERALAFEIPKAANAFDFDTAADVLLEIEYTALASDVYRRAVIARRDSKFSADRAFSLRFNFPDAWYHLNNPGPDTARLETTFETARIDFPPNLEDDSLVIEHMAVLIDTQGMEDATPVDLQLGLASTRKPAGGKPETISGAATVRLGGLSAPGKSLISTQPKSAGVRPDAAWFDMLGTSPIASWTLRIENAPKLRKIFEAGHVEDILLILTVRGRTPSFP